MFLHSRINTLNASAGWRRRLSPLLPWVFILGVVAGTVLSSYGWLQWPGVNPPASSSQTSSRRDEEALWRRAGDLNVRHKVDVIRTIDGDTFEARVALWPGLEMTTHVRLRGIDAPELKASCAAEFRKAEAASVALRALLAEGGVTIYNIGPDKYAGRVVADAATRQTSNVSAALLAGGHARSYSGGHRGGWCDNAAR